MWLNDTTNSTQQAGYADTGGPVVNTQSSFTVASWVYLTDTSAYHTVMSQTSSDKSTFTLRYSAGLQRWVFERSWYASGVRRSAAVAGTAAVTAKAWTHLAAVYDGSAGTISLYVNGRQQGTPVALPAGSALTASDGPLEFGRASYTVGSYVEYWKGRIDEAEVWQRTLTPDEIAVDARLLDANGKPAVENIAQWTPMPGATGATLADSDSGYGRGLTLQGGAALDDGAITFDGVTGAAITTGPVLDETGSFTATTLVQPDKAKLLTKPDGFTAQVAGQRSANGSAWGIWYQLTGRTTTLDDAGNEVLVPTNRWLFGRVNADGTFSGATSETQVGSTDSGDGSNGEGAVRITGVYDAQSGTGTAYLSSNSQDEEPYTAVLGAGDFSVGKAFVNGAWGNYLPGRVAEVRVWSGAMSDGEQIGTVLGD